MKLKVSLLRPGAQPADVVITADVVATVGDVAHALATRDPAGPARPPGGGVVTLRRLGAGGHGVVLDPLTPLVEAPVSAGAHVALTAAGSSWADAGARRGAAAAVLTIRSGPDAGRQVELPAGTSTIGRDPRCDVVLKDSLVSKRHARVVVADVVELIDAGSANGLLLGSGGGTVERVVVGADDVVLVGDTEISVRRLGSGGVEAGAGTIAFTRSPVTQTVFTGVRVEAPEPPAPVQRQSLPLIALLAPLVLGAVLYSVTRSTLSLVFVALTPLLGVAGWLDAALGARRAQRASRAVFERELADADAAVASALVAERTARLAENPSTENVVAAASLLHPLTWSRRPDLPRFLEVRLGLGRVSSRCGLELPAGHQGRASDRAAIAAVAARHATLDGAPVVADLLDLGALGVSGRGAVAAGVARGLLAQIVTLHSPADVVVCATTGTAAAADWQWLTWLPHTSWAGSPVAGSHLAAGPAAGAALVSRLEELVVARATRAPGTRAAATTTGSAPPALPPAGLPAVVLVVGPDSPVEHARLVALAETGSSAGLVVLWCAPEVGQLPAACRAVVEISADGEARATFPRRGERIDPLACESLPTDVADALARRLAPVVDAGARVDDGSDLPRSVALLDLLGAEAADDPDVILGRWEEDGSLVDRSPDATPAPRHRDGTLRALVGLSAAGEFTLDLRSQGPHALVGGTTGAGKSEFLQSWVLAMAAAHSPDRVTFLFVDYKGGSAFGDCLRLPHSVGLVTDLDTHLVRRALASLRAELRHRESVLLRAKKKDLLDMERSGDPTTPPSLVIVVDEFAALASEVPEFVDGVVDVAQRGRSLGLHLVLATQRPAGVITGSLRANTNLRIALRMADEEDSTDVLGVPLAATFDPGVPGRAAARSGPTRMVQFQSGYAGGITTSEPPPAEVEVESLGFGATDVWARPATEPADVVPHGPSDVTRLVSSIRAAAHQAHVPTPRRPWLDVLADGYDVEELHQRTDRDLALGVADDPSRQSQYQVEFHPDTDGNLAVLGTGGSGKSTALRSLAVVAAITPSSGPVHVYGLDFGAGGLAILETLPHVGAVVSGDDHERVARLLGWVRGLVDARATAYAAAHASTITEYRDHTGLSDEPRILLLLDGLAAFRDAYEIGPRSRWWTVLQQIAADGRPVGVHLAVSADRPGAIPSTLSSSIQRRLVLRLASVEDYAMVDVPADILGPHAPPGRGVLGGLEMQVAVLGGSRSVSEQAQALDRLRRTLEGRPGSRAAPVGRLPERVPLASLPTGVHGLPTLGVADDTLAPVAFDPAGVFVVAGPPASGRTTTLATLVASVRRWRPATRTYLLASRATPLAGLGWSERAVTVDDAAALCAQITADLAASDAAPVAVVVEDVPEFVGGLAESALGTLVAACARGGHLCVVDGETSVMNQSWGLMQTVRAGRRGLALQPEQIDGDAVFRTSFPRVGRGEFPPGRGLLVAKGASRRVQVALPEVS